MKRSELKQLIKEEIQKTNNNDLKEKLKKALNALKKGGKITKEALLDFLEGFLKNIDD